ncbi:MAG: inositol monophosphatase family protein [Gammaproteobacteria bacterium]
MDITEIAKAAKQASLIAGKKLRENFFHSQQLIYNSGRDIKLSIDKEIEDLIKTELKEFGFGFLGEETGLEENLEHNFFWVVDPLDGTFNYFRNIPICANSIALMDSNYDVHLAVINNFLHEKLYFAIKGNGSFCNDKPLEVSKVNSPSDGTLMTGIPAKSEYLDSEFEEMISSFQAWKKVRMIGSAAIAGAWVAEGLAESYKEDGIFLWDIAASMLLIAEAGGKINITEPREDMRVNAEFTNGFVY